MLLGKEYELLQVARYRDSGEIYRWMYDRFSMKRLLERIGFVKVKICSADESLIPDWGTCNLDVLDGGQVRKPDSLFIECKKK